MPHDDRDVVNSSNIVDYDDQAWKNGPDRKNAHLILGAACGVDHWPDQSAAALSS
jgi:hypothetical protein